METISIDILYNSHEKISNPGFKVTKNNQIINALYISIGKNI